MRVVLSRLLAEALRRSGVRWAEAEAENFLAWLRLREPRVRWRVGLLLLARFLVRPLRAVGGRLRHRLGIGGVRRGRGSAIGTGVVLRPTVSVPGWGREVYFFARADLDLLTAFARERWPEQVRSVVDSANRLAQGTFHLVSDTPLEFPDRIPWNGPFADREQLFCLNRFGYAPVLAKAYRYTGDASHIGRLKELLTEWGAENPLGRPLTWESYSVAERICNWTHTARLLDGTPEFQEFFQAWLAPQLVQHADYLLGHLETALIHNHLINNGRALLTYGVCFPDLPRAEECRESGWAIVCQEMPRQTRRDGVFREQSTHYHLLLTRTLVECILLARAFGLPVPGTLMTLLEATYAAMADMIRPDGTIPYVGDICPDIESRHLVGLLALGAVLFGRGDLKRSEAINEYALWYLGRQGLEAYLALPEAPPDRWAHNYPEGGLACLGSRSDGGAHVVLRADPLGRVIFHGDMDPLGVDVWMNGHSVIRDPGVFSYARDDCWDYFKGPRAQNTIVVDGLTPWPEAPCGGWLPVTYCAVNAGTAVDGGEGGSLYAEAWHTGYARLPRPVMLRRRVRLNPPAVVTIADTLEGAGSHTADVYFHLGPGHARWTGDRVRLECGDGRAVAWIWPRSASAFRVDLIDGWAAKGYGVKERSQVLRIRLVIEGSTQVETVISSGPARLAHLEAASMERLPVQTNA